MGKTKKLIYDGRLGRTIQVLNAISGWHQTILVLRDVSRR